ncbi:MAG TPA: HEAT repeat domain-containing protein [Verrucomicrobiae bacterium]|nr:HEAT repeat domain-containing protein [Verrucomicrobiae bacterium]
MSKPSETSTSTGRVAALIADLGSDSAVTRDRAYHELVSLRRAAVEPLLDALRKSTEYGRGQAARALGEIGDPAAAPALIKALEDPKFDVRWMAVHAVVALGRVGLTALLRALIERPHSAWLREGAHHVIRDEAHAVWSRQLAPVRKALESLDPEDAVPVAAENALKALASTE